MDERLIRNAIYAASQIVCAQAEAMGMAADNHMRHIQGEPPAYVYDDFMHMIDKYKIHHNGILTMINE